MQVWLPINRVMVPIYVAIMSFLAVVLPMLVKAGIWPGCVPLQDFVLLPCGQAFITAIVTSLLIELGHFPLDKFEVQER